MSNIDELIGKYVQKDGFFHCDGGSDGHSVGILKYKDDSSAHYSTPKYKRQLSLVQCIEGKGVSFKEALINAVKSHRR